MTNTIEKIDDYIQSLSIGELKKIGNNAIPVQLNYTKSEMETAEKIWAIMDLTDLDYDSVETILFDPKQATLSEIVAYCKGLNINVLEFIEKILV